MSFGITKKTLIKEEQMQFIKLITITVVLLSTNLAFAEGEVSTSVMNSEIKKGTIENPDGSFTIYEPRMLRGNTEMPIWGYSDETCALFGFNIHLTDSTIWSEQTVAKSVQLNSDGSYLETKTNSKPYKEITCANEGEFKATPKTTKMTNNPDGSVTISEPRILRGNKEMPLYDGAVGTCALYGFNFYLTGTVIQAEKIARSIKLNNDGSFHKTLTKEKPYKEITCDNEGEFKAVPKAAEISKNPDGSFTIYEPRILRGNMEMPLYHNVGICTLFGFNKYLIDSGIQTKEIAKMIWLNDDGSYYKTTTDKHSYTEITCYNDGDEIINIGTYCKNCN